MSDAPRPEEAPPAFIPRVLPPPEVPKGFLPLRLSLMPSHLLLEINRPDSIVGRHSDCDVRLPLPDVSRHHCRFAFADGIWRIVDLDSLNGVYLNDRKVINEILHPGDIVQIGGFTFRVEESAPAVKKSDASPRPVPDPMPAPDRRAS
jgi:pSer/pThr/pTyr-binding forkhead associated (FHA) protein